MSEVSNFRSQLKATSIKQLQKRIDSDNAMLGSFEKNEYLNLEDGKTIKIRIFPAHPGIEDFYQAKKCYWLPFRGDDGEIHRGHVLDSIVHGGTKMDIITEYVKYAKKKVGNDKEKLEALCGTGMQSQSLNPTYSWLCYADRMVDEEPLKAKIWEFKKMVRDALNKLSYNEGDDEPIEVDPFTDPDEGLPILVSYNKQPNKKKGENYYDVAFPKKVKARPLTDEEIEYFMKLTPIAEMYTNCYGLKQFERALEGLQCFDEENEIDLFDDDEWVEHLEEIRAQYDAEDEEEKKPTKKASKTVEKPAKKKVEEPEDESDDEEEDEVEDEKEDNGEGDEFDGMDRTELKKYINSEGLEITVKKSMSDDDIRDAIRKEVSKPKDNEVEEEEEPEDEKTDEEDDNDTSTVSIEDIRKKLFKK